MNKYHGIFKDWIMWNCVIATPDKKFMLWTTNGFTGFNDYAVATNAKQRNFLGGLSWWDKWLLWREFKREKKRRLLNIANAVDCQELINKLGGK